MSTNYYWKVPPIVLPTGEVFDPDDEDPRIHIGKFYCGEDGPSFSWAQEPEMVVRKVCRARPNETIIINEYGVGYTGAEFLAEDAEIVHHDYRSFGKRFS